MSLTDIWDTKGELERAITGQFTDLMTALSMQDQQTFQKARARVEIEVDLSPTGRQQMALAGKAPDGTISGGFTGLECDIENTFRATIRATLITEADATIHTNFHCQVQHVLARLPPLVNGITLLNHVIYAPMFYGGESYFVKPEGGYYKSVLSYSCNISIHAGAWAKANT